MGFIQNFFAKRMMKKYGADMTQSPEFSQMMEQVQGGQFDQQDVISRVMEAQKEAGDDPQKLAEILQKEFGGETSVTLGSGAGAGGLKFGPDGELIQGRPDEMSGPASEVEEPTGILGQLEKMRDNGAISDAQFEEQKKRLKE